MLLSTCLWAGNNVAAKEGFSALLRLALAQLRIVGAVLLQAAFSSFADAAHAFIQIRGRGSFLQWCIARIHWPPVVPCKRTCASIDASRRVDYWTGAGHCLGVSIVMKVESLSRLQLIGMLTSCGGVILEVTQKSASCVQASVLGDILILVGTVAFASYTIFDKKIFRQHDDLVLNVRVFGLGGVLTLPPGAPSLINMRWAKVPARVR